LTEHTMTFSKWLMCLLLSLCGLLASCATTTPRLSYSAGVSVETLSSAVSMSVHSADRSMSGSGYLVYRRPDKLHLIMLTPFGTTLMEVIAQGERITILYPSSATAYVGRIDELPDKGGLQGWRLMRWVMDVDPPDPGRPDGTVERQGPQGVREQVTYAGGLVTAKSTQNGDQVYYSRYSLVSGVPLANELELRNAREDRIRIVLDEPEVNASLEATAFVPRLDGMTVLPLSALQGM